MPGEALRFRFPTHVEIRYLDDVPCAGQVVRGGGLDWVVRSVERHRSYVLCNLSAWESESRDTDQGRLPEPAGPPAPVGSTRPVDPTAAGPADDGGEREGNGSPADRPAFGGGDALRSAEA